MQRVEKIRLKTERADKHIRDLESEIIIWKKNGYCIDRQTDPDTGDILYKFRIKTPIDPMWGTLVGDAAHNLRTALDHLIYQLIDIKGGTVTNRTAFPIAKSPQAYESEFAAKVDGIDPKAINLIHRFHTYHGGNEDFWRIHEIDRIDKHRLLIPVGAANRQAIFQAINGKASKPIELRFRPNDWLCPLEDGAVIYTFKNAPSAGYHEYDAEFPVEIAVAECTIPMCDPAVPALQEMLNLVKAVIDTFYIEGLLT